MPDREPLVDAEALLALAGELRDLRETLDAAAVTAEQRQRWQGTLAAIAQGATTDLERARGQLRRLAAQVDRTLEAG